MRKILTICLVLLVSGLLFSGCRRKGTGEGTPAPTQRARREDKNVNQEPLENRPYVQLVPRSDGKAITLSINELKKEAADVEYEMEYTSGSLLQGAFGVVDSLSKLPATKEILLGSCSSGGKCTYNKDVSGGTLTLRFGNPDYTVKNEWSYTDKGAKEKIFSSRDAKFSFDISKAKGSLSTVLVFQSPGFPGSPEGTVVAGPYTVSSVGTVTGNVSVSIRVPSDVSAGTILAWDGESWSELKTTVSEGSATGTGPLADAYVVVNK